MPGEQTPATGRLVHYVLDSGRNQGQHRPALIVRTWGDSDNVQSYVNVQVLTDDANDGLPAIMWVTSVQYDPMGLTPRSWHWPEYVPPRPAQEQPQ